MKRYIGVGMIAVLAGAGSWFFGLDILPSIIVVFVIAALGITLRLVATTEDPVLPAGTSEWPPSPPLPSDGARREVSELGWALRTPTGIVEDRVLERVRNIADTSLRRRRLDLDNAADRAAIEGLIGAPVYTLLTSGEPRRASVRTLRSALGLLEALEKTDPAARS